MKKILNHLATDWYKYLLELIVITAGVLGAFSLNSWNEERKFEKERIQYLKNLKSEFQSNHESLENYILRHRSISHMLGRLTRIMKPKPSIVDELTFDSLIYNMALMPNYVPQTSISGSPFLEQMNEDKLKELLTKWSYNMGNYRYSSKIIYDLYYTSIYPFLNKHYQLKNMRGSALFSIKKRSEFPINQEKILSSSSFENDVLMKELNANSVLLHAEMAYKDEENIMIYLDSVLEFK